MSDEITMPVIEKEEARNGKRWFRRRPKPQSGYAALEKRSLVAWRQDIYHKYGPKAQMMVISCATVQQTFLFPKLTYYFPIRWQMQLTN
jgi:hypothetical protein